MAREKGSARGNKTISKGPWLLKSHMFPDDTLPGFASCGVNSLGAEPGVMVRRPLPAPGSCSGRPWGTRDWTPRANLHAYLGGAVLSGWGVDGWPLMSLQPRSALEVGQRGHSLVKPVFQWGVPIPTMVHTFSTVTRTCACTHRKTRGAARTVVAMASYTT